MMTTEPRRKLGKRQIKRDNSAERERREKALETGLEDSSPASDPVATVQPAPSAEDRNCVTLLIKRHDKSDIVELDDGSRWRIWPGDSSKTLQWLPTTEIGISEINDKFCSHVLINQSDGSRVRVIEASRSWPVEQVRQSLKDG